MASFISPTLTLSTLILSLLTLPDTPGRVCYHCNFATWAQVIRFETQRDKQSLGCSVFGYSDAYAKLAPVLRRYQEQRRSCRGDLAQLPQLFLVSADVSQAYDSIHVDKLLNITEPLLKSPHYLILKHAEVFHWQPALIENRIRLDN